MFLAIDTLILERIFTPIAWWFERLTGRTNFYLAWWSYGICLLALVMYIGLGATRTHDLSAPDYIFVPLMVILLGVALMNTQKQDETARKHPEKIVLRAETPFGIFVRMSLVIFLFPNILIAFEAMHEGGLQTLLYNAYALEKVLWALQLLAMICAAYFSSVRRPPPRPKREEAGALQPSALKA